MGYIVLDPGDSYTATKYGVEVVGWHDQSGALDTTCSIERADGTFRVGTSASSGVDPRTLTPSDPMPIGIENGETFHNNSTGSVRSFTIRF